MKKAIVVGASSGIGHQLAVLLAANGYKVGITCRRDQLLLNLQSTNPAQFIVSVFDATDIANPRYLNRLTDELGGLDLLVLSSGTGKINETLDTKIEEETNALNVNAFTAIADWSFSFLRSRDLAILPLLLQLPEFAEAGRRRLILLPRRIKSIIWKD